MRAVMAVLRAAGNMKRRLDHTADIFIPVATNTERHADCLQFNSQPTGLCFA